MGLGDFPLLFRPCVLYIVFVLNLNFYGIFNSDFHLKILLFSPNYFILMFPFSFEEVLGGPCELAFTLPSPLFSFKIKSNKNH